jgi:hypothetical protein
VRRHPVVVQLWWAWVQRQARSCYTPAHLTFVVLPTSAGLRVVLRCRDQRSDEPLEFTRVNRSLPHAHVPFHSTVSITFCALGKNSSKLWGDDSTNMVTVWPFTSSSTMKRIFSPFSTPEVSPSL